MKRHQGFSLIEILVSVLIISVAVVATVKLQKHLFLKSSQAQARLIALELAQAEMEEFRSFVTVNKFKEIATVREANAKSKLLGIYNYKVYWTVTTPFELVTGDNPKRVDITVAWDDIKGKPQEVTLSGFLSPIGNFSGDAIFADLSGYSG